MIGMKKIYKDKIINIEGTDVFDSTFEFGYLNWESIKDTQVVFLSELLEQKKNVLLLAQVKEKPAMWSNVYSPEDELKIFTELFEEVLSNKKRIHIV
jgi:hypothetical protein